MVEYRLYFRGENGAIEARQGFYVDSDAEAIACAALLFDACSDRCAGYELWSGTRLVVEGREKNVGLRFEDLSKQNQERVIALEETLRQSHWSLGRSQRLLQSLEDARAKARGSAPPESE